MHTQLTRYNQSTQLSSPFRTHDHEKIRSEMNNSPRGISPTDSRLNFLMKAKLERTQRNQQRRQLFTTTNYLSANRDEAALAPLPSSTRNSNNASQLTNFHKRHKTIDHGPLESVGGSVLGRHRNSVGPIGVPADPTPKDEFKHKN